MGDKFGKIDYCTCVFDLYTLAGQGIVNGIEAKFKFCTQKAIKQMCSPQKNYPYFPVDVAFHNGAQVSGLVLLYKGSVYFDTLNTITILNEGIDPEHKIDYDTRMKTPAFMLLCWDKDNPSNIYKISDIDDLKTKFGDSKYEFPDREVMEKFCQSRLDVLQKEHDFVSKSRDPFDKRREPFVKDSIKLVQQVLEVFS